MNPRRRKKRKEKLPGDEWLKENKHILPKGALPTPPGAYPRDYPASPHPVSAFEEESLSPLPKMRSSAPFEVPGASLSLFPQDKEEGPRLPQGLDPPRVEQEELGGKPQPARREVPTVEETGNSSEEPQIKEPVCPLLGSKCLYEMCLWWHEGLHSCHVSSLSAQLSEMTNRQTVFEDWLKYRLGEPQ